ncbi:unnamed protein product [Pylaiella littoralis]
MSIPIPPAQKPIQLYLWSACKHCTEQVKVLSSMDAEMQNWLSRNVSATTVTDPKMFPMIKSYPFWVVAGRAEPGFKSLRQVVSMRHVAA